MDPEPTLPARPASLAAEYCTECGEWMGDELSGDTLCDRCHTPPIWRGHDEH